MTTGQTVAVPRRVLVAFARQTLEQVVHGGPGAAGAARALGLCLSWLGYEVEQPDQQAELRQRPQGERF